MPDFDCTLVAIVDDCDVNDNGGVRKVQLTKLSNIATLEVDGTSGLVDVLTVTASGELVTVDVEAADETTAEIMTTDLADSPLSAAENYTFTGTFRVKGYSQDVADALNALRCKCPLVAILTMVNGDRFLLGVQPTGVSNGFDKSYPRPLFASQAANVNFGTFADKITTTFTLKCIDSKAPLRLDAAVEI